MKRQITAIAVALAVASTLLIASPAMASEPAPAGVSMVIPVAGDGLTAGSQQFGLEGRSRVEVRQVGTSSVVAPSGPIEGKDFSIGLGWYIYVYLDRGDWIYLAGLGYAGASAALCAWLVVTIAGAIACGMAAYIVGSWIIPKTAPPTGYCREFKFSYAGTYSGSKLVKRSC